MDDYTHDYRQRHTPRFRRIDPALLPFELQPRDVRWLKTIFEYRYATAAILDLMEPEPGVAPAGLQRFNAQRLQSTATADRDLATRPWHPRRVTRQRLQYLFHHAVVDRHKITTNEPILYSIGRNAVDVLASHYRIDVEALKRAARAGASKDRNLRHALSLSNFHCALEVGVRVRLGVALAFWLGDGTKYQIPLVKEDGSVTYATLVPDATFGLWVGERLEVFFVEVDRENFDAQRLRREKFIPYAALHDYYFGKRDRRADAYLHPQPNMPRDPLIINGHTVTNGFRVLWVAPTAEHGQWLREAARQEGTPYARTVGMFWFAAEPSFIASSSGPLVEPGVFGAIWQKPRSDKWRCLLE